MNAKRNLLEAVRFGDPDWVPLGNEEVAWGFQLEGNIKMESWTDLWGVEWEVGLADTVPFPKGNPLPSLEELDDYRFPDPDELRFTDEMAVALEQVDREQRLLVGHLTYLLFERAWAIMGMDNFLTSLISHPEAAHRFLHGIATFSRGVFDRYLELGVEGIGFSEDLGTQRAPFLSPAMFREFILPEYEFIFENALAEGAVIFFHSCGCVEGVAADLADIGVTCLNPVQHRANDLRRIKDETFGRTALQGAVDTAVLADGTPEDVRAEVAAVMEVLKPGGGYICQPDQGIPGIPQQNIDAMWRAARELGQY